MFELMKVLEKENITQKECSTLIYITIGFCFVEWNLKKDSRPDNNIPKEYRYLTNSFCFYYIYFPIFTFFSFFLEWKKQKMQKKKQTKINKLLF